jgi:hypothetical protein
MTSLTTILRNRVKVWKSKDYIKYLKERFPGQDLHHLLGSFTSCKITDSLIVPLSREEHGRVHKMTKDECLETYLATAINLLQEYITRLEHENG